MIRKIYTGIECTTHAGEILKDLHELKMAKKYPKPMRFCAEARISNDALRSTPVVIRTWFYFMLHLPPFLPPLLYEKSVWLILLGVVVILGVWPAAGSYNGFRSGPKPTLTASGRKLKHRYQRRF